MDANFWESKTLEQLTADEWESLCDGCGKCCLHKLEDEDTDEVFYTNVACRLLNTGTCKCRDYSGRKKEIPDCLVLTVEDIPSFHWLPSTCAYRLIADGKGLFDWHPLIAGKDEIHLQGFSVQNKVISGEYIHPDDFEEHIVRWV